MSCATAKKTVVTKKYSCDILELPEYLTQQAGEGLHIKKITPAWLVFEQGEPSKTDYKMIPVNNSVEFDHLKELPGVLKEKFGGVLPNTVEELCELPGVGRKTANLTVAVGFDLPAICVDVHVHRITNRLGLIKTKSPFETEMALRKILPVKYWKTWNSHLVSFGQTRCAPRGPKCGDCPIAKFCPSCGRG